METVTTKVIKIEESSFHGNNSMKKLICSNGDIMPLFNRIYKNGELIDNPLYNEFSEGDDISITKSSFKLTPITL